MPGRKKITSQSNRKKSTRTKISWIEILRLDESYTSLLLGIIVVLIGLVLLISFVKNRHIHTPQQATASISIGPVKTALRNIPLTVSPSPSPTTTTIITTIPTHLEVPTVTSTPQEYPPTNPTEKVVPASIYTVKPGDDLWHIAQMYYGSGYNWVTIAKANSLDRPGLLYSGEKLKLPAGTPIIVAQHQVNQQYLTQTQNLGPSIVTSTYTVEKGDSLWTIAVRAYNDGNKWTVIASANKLMNPNIIHSGNVLTIPRTLQ